MRTNPLISVIIPTYNRKNTLPRAIMSVINQTYKEWELIIVDDGSNDNTEKIVYDIIKKNKMSKKILFFKQSKKGANAARNLGISKAKGKYISFLDSDDSFLKTRLDYNLKVINSYNAPFYLCNSIEIRSNKSYLASKYSFNCIINKDMIIEGLVPLSASFMFGSRKIFQNIKFDENLPSQQDLDFILRYLNKEHKLILISKALVKRYKNLTEGRISSNLSLKIEGLNVILKKSQENLYKLNSKEQNNMYFLIFSQIGLFQILNKDYEIARYNLKKALKIKSIPYKRKIKFYILYYSSYSNICTLTMILFANYLWKRGILNLK